MLEQKITVPTVGSNTGFTATQTYAYDALNRLSSATETISSTQTWKQEFSYDRYGNRSYVTGTGHTTSLGACTTACNPAFDAATNRFGASQGFTYDANGSLTVDALNGHQYVLDAENRQVQVISNANVSLAQYSYDGEGRRVSKFNAGSSSYLHFIYDVFGNLLEEWSVSGTRIKKKGYIYAGSRIIATEDSSGTPTYVTLDHLGSTRVETNSSGTVTARKDFMSFGEEAITSQRIAGLGYNVPSTRKDYTGYEKESESGLEFAQARYQNPIHGRFTSVDPLTASAEIKNPQTFNRYTYALNSPYKFVDPLGLLAEERTGACGGRCKNSYGGAGGGYISLYTGMGELQAASVPVGDSSSEFSIFTPGAVGYLPVSRKSMEELTGKRVEIDGKEVFVELGFDAVKGELQIKKTDTTISAFQKAGDLQVKIIDKDGNKISGSNIDKQVKELANEAAKIARSSGLDARSNCHGTTFASGKYWIPDGQITAGTLRTMGYQKVDGQPQENDVGMFMDDNIFVHSVRYNKDTTTVRSKGGLEPYQASVAITAAWTKPGQLQVWRKSK